MADSELQLRHAQVMFEAAMAMQTIASDAARFLAVITQQSSVPDLKTLLLKGIAQIQDFCSTPISISNFQLDQKNGLPQIGSAPLPSDAG
jgi:hypothetical protein